MKAQTPHKDIQKKINQPCEENEQEFGSNPTTLGLYRHLEMTRKSSTKCAQIKVRLLRLGQGYSLPKQQPQPQQQYITQYPSSSVLLLTCDGLCGCVCKLLS